jgi:NAD/NADP transhydrogenase beta subunit
LRNTTSWQSSYAFPTYDAVVITFAILIGGLTFTGSLIAWGKLSGTMDQKAVVLPGQNVIVSGSAGSGCCLVLFSSALILSSGISWICGSTS